MCLISEMNWNEDSARYWQYQSYKTQYLSPSFEEMDSIYNTSPSRENYNHPNGSTDNSYYSQVPYTFTPHAQNPQVHARYSTEHEVENLPNIPRPPYADKNNGLSARKPIIRGGFQSLPKRKTYHNQRRYPNSAGPSLYRDSSRHMQQFYMPHPHVRKDYCSCRRKREYFNAYHAYNTYCNAYYQDSPRYCKPYRGNFSPDCCQRSNFYNKSHARKQLKFNKSSMYSSPSCYHNTTEDHQDNMHPPNQCGKCNVLCSELQVGEATNISMIDKERFPSVKDDKTKCQTSDQSVSMQEGNSLDSQKISEGLAKATESAIADIHPSQFEFYDLEISQIEKEAFLIKQKEGDIGYSSTAYAWHEQSRDISENEKINEQQCYFVEEHASYSEDRSSIQVSYSPANVLISAPGDGIFSLHHNEQLPNELSIDNKFNVILNDCQDIDFCLEANSTISKKQIYSEEKDECRTPSENVIEHASHSNTYQETPICEPYRIGNANSKDILLVTKSMKKARSMLDDNSAPKIGIKSFSGDIKGLTPILRSSGDDIVKTPCMNIRSIKNQTNVEQSIEKYYNVGTNDHIQEGEEFEIESANIVSLSHPSIQELSSNAGTSNGKTKTSARKKKTSTPKAKTRTLSKNERNTENVSVLSNGTKQWENLQISANQVSAEKLQDTRIESTATPKQKSRETYSASAENFQKVRSNRNSVINRRNSLCRKKDTGEILDGTFPRLRKSLELERQYYPTEVQTEYVILDETLSEVFNSNDSLFSRDDFLPDLDSLREEYKSIFGLNVDKTGNKSEIDEQKDNINDQKKALKQAWGEEYTVHGDKKETENYEEIFTSIENIMLFTGISEDLSEISDILNTNAKNSKNNTSLSECIDDDFLSELLYSTRHPQTNKSKKYFEGDILKDQDELDKGIGQYQLNLKSVNVSIQTDDLLLKTSSSHGITTQTDWSINPGVFYLTNSTQTDNISTIPLTQTVSKADSHEQKKEQFENSNEAIPNSNLEMESQTKSSDEFDQNLNLRSPPKDQLEFICFNYPEFETSTISETQVCPNSMAYIFTKCTAEKQKDLHQTNVVLQSSNTSCLNNLQTKCNIEKYFKTKLNLNNLELEDLQPYELDQRGNSADIGVATADPSPKAKNETPLNEAKGEISNLSPTNHYNMNESTYENIKQSTHDSEVQHKNKVRFASPLIMDSPNNQHTVLSIRNDTEISPTETDTLSRKSTIANTKPYEVDKEHTSKSNKQRTSILKNGSSDSTAACKSREDIINSTIELNIPFKSAVITPSKTTRKSLPDENKSCEVRKQHEMELYTEEIQKSIENENQNCLNNFLAQNSPDSSSKKSTKAKPEGKTTVVTKNKSEEVLTSKNMEDQPGKDDKMYKLKPKKGTKSKKKNLKKVKDPKENKPDKIQNETLDVKRKAIQRKSFNDVAKQNPKPFQRVEDELDDAKKEESELERETLIEQIPRRITRNYSQHLKMLQMLKNKENEYNK